MWGMGKCAWFPGFGFVYPLVPTIDVIVHTLPKTLMISAMIYTFQNVTVSVQVTRQPMCSLYLCACATCHLVKFPSLAHMTAAIQSSHHVCKHATCHPVLLPCLSI